MRVINNHQKRLSFIDLLETPRHQFKICDSMFNFRSRDFKRNRGADRAQDVVNIDAPDQRRARLDFPGGRLRSKLCAVKS